jgi:hypothetical protein
MANFYASYPIEGSMGGSGVTSLNSLTGALTLVAGSGISITPSGSNLTIAATGGSGTVTSVALADGSTTPIYTISGSPVTTSGTLTLTLGTQTANTVFAGPTSGGASQPAFRALVSADLPAISPSKLTLTDNHVFVGNASNVAADVAMSGDIAIVASGATTVEAIQGTTVSGTTGTTDVVFSSSPTIATPTITTYAIDPLLIGGTTPTSSLSLQSTSGVGTTDFINFLVGNDGATEAMRVIDNGYVGIGTTTPNDQLEIQSAALGGSAGNVSPILRLTTSTSNADIIDIFKSRDSNGGDWTSASTYIREYVDGTPMGYIQFNPPAAKGGIQFGSWMYGGAAILITSNGTVGVQTTTPQSTFDVAGNVSLGAYGGVDAAPANGLIVSGNVGIGTATPSVQLEVDGAVLFDTTLNVTGLINNAALTASEPVVTDASQNLASQSYATFTSLLSLFTSTTQGLVPASGGGTTHFLRADGTFATPPGGGGTVTSVSVVSANGFAGTVATATTTPAITLSTTITGILQGNGTAISAATTGNLTDAGTDGITITGGTGAVLGSGTTISQHVADTTHNGYLSSTDWNTFNGKGSGSVTSVAFSDGSSTPIYAVSGSPITTSGTLTITLDTQSANTVFAGPTSGAAAQPTFRSLVSADLPAISPSGITLTDNHILVGNASNVAADVAMSGDATIVASGALTLATVNSNVGTFGSSTSIPTFTVNAKGLITAASGNVVIAPAGTLTGTTLASNVVTSSLTSVGTITSGTWNGTTIAIANGGTGQTTASAAFGALSPLTTKGDILGYSTLNARVPIGTDGQVLTADSTQTLGLKWATPTTGTVTSVAFSDGSSTPIYAVTGSPVTSSGTLTITLDTQSANTVFAGPTSGAAAQPTFRALVAADLPAGTGTVTSVALTVPAFLSVSGSPITTSGTLAVTLSGTALPVANGGTGQTSLTNHGVLVGAGTSGITQLAAAAAGTLLAGQGTSSDPNFTATPTLGVNATTAGTLSLATSTALGASVTLQNLATTTAWNFNLPTTAGTSGQVLTSQAGGSTSMTWTTPTTGTVTSVALTVPSILSVSGSPVTTSGTLAVTLATQPANTVFAGPTSGAAATPTFRSLVVADMTIANQAISASNIDWSTGNGFSKTLSANTTFTFSNQLTGQTLIVRLTNTASNYTVTWPTVRWAGGTAPTMSPGAVSDVYTFYNDGSNIYGSYVQNLS